MSRPGPGTGPARFLLCLVVLATAGLVLFAGCTTSPGGGQGQPAVTAATPPSLPSYVEHVPGTVSHGFVLLVGRSTCPHCQNTKAILANLSIDYYWIDVGTLDQANTTEVLQEVAPVCKDTQYVPMLIVNGQTCVIGDNETQIREALA